MMGKIISKIMGNWDTVDNSKRPIRVIKNSENSWSLVYAD